MSPELEFFLSSLQNYVLADRADEAGPLASYRQFLAACDLPYFVLAYIQKYTGSVPEKFEKTVADIFRARHNELLIATFALLPVLRLHFERKQEDFEKRLTARETDVLDFFAQGMRPDRIADAMGVAKVTVDLHAANARKKLCAQTIPEAVAKGIRYGLI